MPGIILDPVDVFSKWDNAVLFDDSFSDGFCGWEELFTDPANSPAVATSGPLSLGAHTQMFGSKTLRLATHSVADPAYASQCNALKRLTVPLVGRNKVTFEAWIAFGSESQAASAPRYIFLMVDEMYGGVRNFWKVRWRQWDEGGGVKADDWWVSSTTENNFIAAGPAGGQYLSDLPFNGNKGNVMRLAFTVDLKNSAYVSLEALDRAGPNVSAAPGLGLAGSAFDLTATPGIAAPLAAVDNTFNNGLNFQISLVNRASTALTASWLEVARARATMHS